MILGKVAMGAFGVVLVGGALLCSEGFVTLRVHEHQANGTHISIVAPAALLPLGIGFVPQEKRAHMREKIGPYLPMIRVALEELGKSSDATFVEVKDHSDHVSVVKRGGSLVIDVEDPGDTVHVSVPFGAMESAIDELAVGAPTS